MSSTSESADIAETTDWEDLTQTQQRVAKTITHVHGPSTFERPDLRDDVEDSSTLGEVIEDPDDILTSLNDTTHLNNLEEHGYLVKEYQGGENPIILDLGYEEERDEIEVAPYGASSKLHTIAAQVLDREGRSESVLEGVDEDDFNAVRDAVNRAVGKTVLVTVSEASEYRFTKEAYSLVATKVEEAREEDS